MTLSLNDSVVGVAGHVQTLFEELQGQIELRLVQVLVSNELVDSDQVLGDDLLNLVLLALLRLLKSRF